MTLKQVLLAMTVNFGLVFGISSTHGQDANTRAAIVESVHNETPGFMVRVDVNHANRIYRAGEDLKVTVKSEKAGYLYLVYTQADNKLSVLFPNKYQTDNYIPASELVHIPPREGATFRIRIGEPLGEEVLTAIVSPEPLKSLDTKSLTTGIGTEVGYETVKAAFVEGTRENTVRFSEHHVKIKTVSADVPVTTRKPRRIGVFIGLSRFKDRNIPQLSICHLDAYTMCEVMKPGLDHAFLLTNEQATLKNIEDCIRRTLVELSEPGDEIFIFWSGHGGRCADQNGDEKDGLDEYLVAYDSQRNKYETMLLDDQFGRWVQGLDGRKIVVILDTCHSAGNATNEKQISKGLDSPGIKAIGDAADFLDGELARTKDLGQQETAILASSRAAQVSFERRQGDLSAMTYFLTKLLLASTDGVTLNQAYEHVRVEVPRYISREFPGTTQDPVLIDETTPPVYLLPKRSSPRE